MKKLSIAFLLIVSSLSTHAAPFQIFFVCDTTASQNPYIHEQMAISVMTALSQGDLEIYSSVLSSYRSCREYLDEVKNIKLLKETGKLVNIRDGVSYYVVPVGKFTTVGVVGR